MNIFHIAIPTHDLEAATQFYTALGAIPARRRDDRQTFRWFDHQLVCHLCPDEVRFTGKPLQHAYPRHFGMTFEQEADFDAAVALCVAAEATMQPGVDPLCRPARTPQDRVRRRPLGEHHRVQMVLRSPPCLLSQRPGVLCLVFPLWALAAGLWQAVQFAHDAGWRINYSPSMPMGVWRLHPVAEPFQREQIVSICPPDRAVVRDARRRGYIGKGDCPGGYEPLLKPVAAIPGDVVTVDADGIAVNGRSLTNSAALTVDGRERRNSEPRPRHLHRFAWRALADLNIPSGKL